MLLNLTRLFDYTCGVKNEGRYLYLGVLTLYVTSWKVPKLYIYLYHPIIGWDGCYHLVVDIYVFTSRYV